MNTRIWLLLALLLALSLAACQPSATPTPAQEETEAVTPPPAATQAPEQPAEAYPAPGQQNAPSGEGSYPPPSQVNAVPYPAPGQFEEIDWEQAREMILAGEVTSVAQAHSLRVTLVLKDGRTMVTNEPTIDEVFRLVAECGEPCEGMSLATE